MMENCVGVGCTLEIDSPATIFCSPMLPSLKMGSQTVVTNVRKMDSFFEIFAIITKFHGSDALFRYLRLCQV